MKQAKDPAEQLFKFIHSACFSGQTENLGGHHGMNGMMRGLREDLIKDTGVICGQLRSSSLTPEQTDQYLGLCRTAMVTGVLSDADFEYIVNIFEGE